MWMGLPMHEGFEDGVFAVRFGDELEMSARLHFDDEAGAARGAKMARRYLEVCGLGIGAARSMLDLGEALPKRAQWSAHMEASLRKGSRQLLKPLEEAALACKPTARGKMVPLHTKAALPARHIAQAAPEFIAGLGFDGPGVFFGERAH